MTALRAKLAALGARIRRWWRPWEDQVAVLRAEIAGVRGSLEAERALRRAAEAQRDAGMARLSAEQHRQKAVLLNHTWWLRAHWEVGSTTRRHELQAAYDRQRAKRLARVPARTNGAPVPSPGEQTEASGGAAAPDRASDRMAAQG